MIFLQKVMFCNKSNEILLFLLPWIIPFVGWCPRWAIVFDRSAAGISLLWQIWNYVQFDRNFMFCYKSPVILLFSMLLCLIFVDWKSCWDHVLQQVKWNIAISRIIQFLRFYQHFSFYDKNALTADGAFLRPPGAFPWPPAPPPVASSGLLGLPPLLQCSFPIKALLRNDPKSLLGSLPSSGARFLLKL